MGSLRATWGGFALFKFNLTECPLSNIAENEAYSSYQLGVPMQLQSRRLAELCDVGRGEPARQPLPGEALKLLAQEIIHASDRLASSRNHTNRVERAVLRVPLVFKNKPPALRKPPKACGRVILIPDPLLSKDAEHTANSTVDPRAISRLNHRDSSGFENPEYLQQQRVQQPKTCRE